LNKTTALFQVVTEMFLIGVFAMCLAPSIFAINVDLWGLKMDLNVKDLLRLSDSICTICLVASMAMFIIVVLFSFTIKDSERVRRFNVIPPHRVHRKKSKTTSNQPKGNNLTEEAHQPS
jgi:hypothetical protein